MEDRIERSERGGIRAARARILSALLVLLLVALGCAGLGRPEPDRKGPPFSHDDFDSFLRRHVDDVGRIDYARAGADREDLDRYLAALASTSPDHAPGRFPTEAERLAYWLNAYNASVIGLVLDHYPISSVIDVRAPWLLRFLPEGAGFFVFRPITLGERRTSLYSLENRLIRRRFPDPRIHFALNCASASCPRLPAEAFLAERLEEQLARETDRFLAERRNVEVDADASRLRVSSIFDWYESDFTSWVERERPGEPPTLRSYLLHHLPAATADALRACGSCEVEPIPYDWALNDRSSARAAGADGRRRARRPAHRASRFGWHAAHPDTVLVGASESRAATSKSTGARGNEAQAAADRGGSGPRAAAAPGG